MLITIDLGEIPRVPLELAKPMIEDSLKKMMAESFEKSGMKTKGILLEIKE